MNENANIFLFIIYCERMRQAPLNDSHDVILQKLAVTCALDFMKQRETILEIIDKKY